jgi:hypothetical protein
VIVSVGIRGHGTTEAAMSQRSEALRRPCASQCLVTVASSSAYGFHQTGICISRIEITSIAIASEKLVCYIKSRHELGDRMATYLQNNSQAEPVPNELTNIQNVR